jgi:hypothetical protein
MPVHKQPVRRSQPDPVKWAMARMGLCGGTMRLPMTPMSASTSPWSKAPCAPPVWSEPVMRTPRKLSVKPFATTGHRLAWASILIAALPACSVLQEDKVDYKSAGSAPTLEVPPDLTKLSTETRYTVPGGSVTASGMARTAQARPAPVWRSSRSVTFASKSWPISAGWWSTARRAALGPGA